MVACAAAAAAAAAARRGNLVLLLYPVQLSQRLLQQVQRMLLLSFPLHLLQLSMLLPLPLLLPQLMLCLLLHLPWWNASADPAAGLQYDTRQSRAYNARCGSCISHSSLRRLSCPPKMRWSTPITTSLNSRERPGLAKVPEL
jgi:hypothetical protein